MCDGLLCPTTRDRRGLCTKGVLPRVGRGDEALNPEGA